MMNFKRILAFVLSLCMVLTLAPMSTVAFATEKETNNSQNLEIQQLNPDEVDVRLPMNGLENPLAVEPMDEDETVKVLIIMDSDSVIEENPVAVLSESEEEILVLEREQAEVVRAIEEDVLDGEPLTVNYSYTWLLNGIAADVPYGSIQEIRAVDGVKQVLIQPVYQVCETETADPLTITGGAMIGRENTWAAGYTGEGMKIAIIDTGLDHDHPNFAPLGEEIPVTADLSTVAEVLDSLNAADIYDGLTAEDVYYSSKVAYGFNYVDQNLNITHDLDNRGDHGTHVAGIAAANKVEGSEVVGVAPNAQLYVMKVFGANGGAYTEDILAALDDALKLGADVVNMSLGTPAGFTFSSDEINAIYDRVAETGTVLSVSAGNSYTAGFGNQWGNDRNLASNPDNAVVGEPAAYNNVMSVASVENSYVQREYILVSDGNRMIYNDTGISYYLPGITTLTGAYSFVAVPGVGAAEDYEGLDVTGKVALVSRGEINFGNKVTFAEDAGAVACIVYNNADGEFGMDLSDCYAGIPAISITREDAAYLLAAQEADPTVTISFPVDVVSFPSDTAWQMSDFSSWGVAPDLSLEPDITAPGGNIYSTINNGGYGLMSGTSMAAPNVAGLTALVMEYIQKTMPGLEDTQARVMAQYLLISTSEPLAYEDGGYYSPRHQGSGLANAYNAVTTTTYLTVDGMDVPKVELGDDDDRTGAYGYSFNVHNFGDGKAFYEISTVIQSEDVVVENGNTFMASTPLVLDGATAANAENLVLVHDLDDNAVTNSHDAYILYRATQGDRAENYAAEEFRYDTDRVNEVTTNDVQAYLDALVGNESAADLSREALVVEAGQTAEVSISVAVADSSKAFLDANFPNGIYVEGFTFLDALNADMVDLSLPYLAFYGDWDDAPIIDSGDYWEAHNAQEDEVVGNQYFNILWTEMGEPSGAYPGMNPYMQEELDLSHISLSPNDDRYFDTIDDIYTSLLRNAGVLEYRFTDITDPENPQLLYETGVLHVGKSVYNTGNQMILPAIASWNVDLFDWSGLENNDQVLVEVIATGAYENAHSETWSVPVTVDLEAPQLLEAKLEGSTLELTFRDNLACSVVILSDVNGEKLYAMEGVADVAEDENGYQNYTKTFDISGITGKLMIVLSDYAVNESYYALNLGGEGTDYGALVGYSYNPDTGTNSWVSFDADVNRDEVAIFSGDGSIACAEFVDGYVFAQDNTGALYGFRYEDMLKNTFDLETTFVAQLDNVYQDLAYSYVEGKLYGLLTTADNWGPTSEIFTINLNGAYYDEDLWMDVAPYQEDWFASRGSVYALALAIDDEGTMYMMANNYEEIQDDEGNWVSQYSETAHLWAAKREVSTDSWGSYVDYIFQDKGDTGLSMDFLQAMTWDHNAEKLYWARFDGGASGFESELYEVSLAVDAETGEETVSCVKSGDLTGETWALFAPMSAETAAKPEHQNIPEMDPEQYGMPILRDDVITMNVTGTKKLAYDLDPWYTNYKDVVWSSSDESVVAVDEDGVIHCLTAGSATITVANALDESLFDTVNVEVTALDLTIEGLISTQGSGIGSASNPRTYRFDMVQGIASFTDGVAITDPNGISAGMSLATSALGRGSIWTSEFGNTGTVYSINAETGAIETVLEPIDGDMMFGLSYSESMDTFTGIMNMYIYADLQLTAEESEAIKGTYDEENKQFTYHRINMLPYLNEAGGNFVTGETGQGASSEIVFCGITTIEGGMKDMYGEYFYYDTYKDYMGNWAYEGSVNYMPTQTLVLLDNVGRLWYIDEIANMTKTSDEYGNCFYTDANGSDIQHYGQHRNGMFEIELGVNEDGTTQCSVFNIRRIAETPLTDMFRDGTMPRITYHFSDIEYVGNTEDGDPMIIMSLYDYWNNGTTNELYLFIAGHETEDWDYENNCAVFTPDRMYNLGTTGEHNIIASVHSASVTGGVDPVIDNVQTEDEYVEELGINTLAAPAYMAE